MEKIINKIFSAHIEEMKIDGCQSISLGQDFSNGCCENLWRTYTQEDAAIMLEIRNLRKSFGGVVAVNNVSFRIESRTIEGLIGPNGAGKSTITNLISGIEKADAGEILFKGKNITNQKPHETARQGIGRTFQICRLFWGMTVFENLCMSRIWKDEKLCDIKKRVVETLDFYELSHMKDELASSLSGGQQRILEMARATMSDPDLLLLDEPFYGLHPTIQKKITDFMSSLNRTGTTILLVSHDVPTIMALCHNVLVMNSGELIAEGTPEEIQRNESVIEAYLGV